MARGTCFLSVAVAIALIASPVAAQNENQRIQQLENRLDELVHQVDSIRHELDALKAASGAPAAAPAQLAVTDDLTKVDVVTAAKTPPPPAPQTAEAAAPSLTDVQPIANQVSPGAGKALNPDISVIGNFLGHAGSQNPYEFGPQNMRSPASFDEAEAGFEAFVDPYAKAKFFLSFTPEAVGVEEGYAQFVTLPYGLTAKVGKMKAAFGKANTWHTHARPWIDQPLVIHNFFGDEQLSDSGVSVSRILPVKTAFVEATGEVLSGRVDGLFDRRNQNDLLYNTHLKLFRDISENSNVELGTSYTRGTLSEGAGANQFGGIDVTYRWKPLERSIYNSLILRFEGLANRRDDSDRTLRGFYASADYQFAQRWFTGVRLDSADRHLPLGDQAAAGLTHPFTDRGASATLTFWPSEFSQVRGQLRRTSYGGLQAVNEFLIQLQFAIGAHGAHTF